MLQTVDQNDGDRIWNVQAPKMRLRTANRERTPLSLCYRWPVRSTRMDRRGETRAAY
jgi:hypothetical protein